MALSSDLISQFAKIVNSDKKNTNTESTVYGTVVEYNNKKYVKIDGSDQITPVSTTTDMEVGERVTVQIKNHTATVTGNISSPSARTDTVKEVEKKVEEEATKITEFEIAIGKKVDTEQLNAESARIDSLVSDNVIIKGKLEAAEAEIDDLTAENVEISGKLTAAEAEIDDISAKMLTAEVAKLTYAEIKDLEASVADIRKLEADYLTVNDTLDAHKAEIDDLEAKKLTAEQADILYANIDFANIDMAAVEKLFADSGIIEDLVVSDGKITGELVGVTIKGDVIEGGTVIADKLVIKGSDGLYYKLNTNGESVETAQTEYNSLNGSIITAKSITATKIAVEDLVAFGATIGGFHITNDSLYSGAKASVSNTTTGIYLDKTGQIAFGDGNSYIKYYKDGDIWKLAIAADDVMIGSSKKTVETYVNTAVTSINGNISDIQSSLNETSTNLSDLQTEYENTYQIVTENSTKITELLTSSTGIEMNFKTLESTVTELNGQMNTEYNERYKYIRFDDDGIHLGKLPEEGEDDLQLIISNEKMSFTLNGEEVAYFSNDSLYVTTIRVTKALRFGNFEFAERSNGNMGLRWVGVS